MGYLQEKYTSNYFLKKDEVGNRTTYGVAGIEEFENGQIREADKNILDRLDFNGKNVLDLGCGRGESLKYASEHGASLITGVDFAEDAIHIARAFSDSYGIEADLHCADALAYLRNHSSSHPNEKFDIVIMFDSAEHIPRYEFSEILVEIQKSISQFGILAINTPHFGIDNDVILEGLKDMARDGSDACATTIGMHCNRFTKYSLRRYLNNHGFYAISAHLYLPKFIAVSLLQGSKWSRRLSLQLGYPILMPNVLEPEIYEGLSWWTHPLFIPVRWLYCKWKYRNLACQPYPHTNTAT